MKREKILLSIIIAVQMIVMVYYGNQKIDFHVDEIFTYGLSNSSYGIQLKIPEEKIVNPDFFAEYLTAHNDSKFNYANVWSNQADDVHPPLYYVFIHTISSLMPGVFSKWIGIGFNIVIAIVCSIILYFIAKHFIKNKYVSLFFILIWSVSPAFVNAVMLIRMYVFLMMWVLLLTLLHVKYYNQTLHKRFYLLLYAYSSQTA